MSSSSTEANPPPAKAPSAIKAPTDLASLSLTPSQAINSSSNNSSNTRSRNRRRGNNKNRGGNNNNNNNNNTMNASQQQQQKPPDGASTNSALTATSNNSNDGAAAAAAGATAEASTPPTGTANNQDGTPQGGRRSGGGGGGGGGRRRNNKNKKKNPPIKNSAGNAKEETEAASPVAAAETKKDTSTNSNTSPKKTNRNRKRNKKKKNDDDKRYPWRKFIPEDTMDPITLDPLHALPYPPFALHAEAPYDPIEEWPVMPDEDDDTKDSKSKTSLLTWQQQEEERQKRILAEQWGHKLNDIAVVEQDDSKLADSASAGSSNNKNSQEKKRRDHYNLYDGRALAYYMVSQLQFIDPLNRRDLTRDEIVNLDRYLRRHAHICNKHNKGNHHHHHHHGGDNNSKNMHILNVTEAYDAKGMTLSSAGAVAHTAAGRAAMLQQEAALLLNALFGGGDATMQAASSSSRNNNDDGSGGGGNALMRQYQASQQHQQSRQHQQSNDRNTDWRHQDHDTGIYGNAGGLLIIDDDINPGLRGDATEFVPSSSVASAQTTSANDIAARYGHAARQQALEFPSLSSTATTAAPATNSNTAAATQSTTAAATTGNSSAAAATNNSARSKPLPKAKTLSKIGGIVKKTDPEERQRQWEAREDARRRALMSKLTFNPAASGVATVGGGGSDEIPSNITTVTTGVPSEAQLERNRAFAQALGVTPATVRQQQVSVNAGWARPTNNATGASAGQPVDEFGNELGVTLYPDALILQARERMGLLLKLEKKWKAFLKDDKAASLPLNAMDRPTRTFVHHYSDFWKLQTESFDAEPKRYIHCVKLRDTGMPYPLLSQAVREWKGPQPFLASLHLQPVTTTIASSSSDHDLLQTAGQSTSGSRREIPSPPERTPLPLKPRSVATDITAATTTSVSMPATGMAGAPTRTMVGEGATNTRFDALTEGAKRERPKLDLQKRSLPLELPPYDPNGGDSNNGTFDVQEEMKRSKKLAQEKAERERKAAEEKRLALEAAFASDDEDDETPKKKSSSGGRQAASAFDDSDDEWVEQEPEYVGDGDDF